MYIGTRGGAFHEMESNISGLITSLFFLICLGTSCRYVSSELVPDVAITVGEVKFYLHKVCYIAK